MVSAPLGIVFLGPLAATSAAWAGVGGLIIVAVNPKEVDVASLLANAETRVVADDVSDTDDPLEAAFETAAE